MKAVVPVILALLASCTSWSLQPPPVRHGAGAAGQDDGGGGDGGDGMGGFSGSEACDPPLPDDPVASAVFRAMRPHLRDQETGAVGVVVVREGRIAYAGGLGSESMAGCRPIKSSSVFQTSLGELLLASSMLAASAAGELDLQAPLRELVPEVIKADPTLPPEITLLDVVSGTSGLGPEQLDLSCQGELDGSLADFVGNHRWRTLHAAGVMYLDPEGSVLDLLGMLALQNALREPYAEAASDLVLRPLGLQFGLEPGSFSTVETGRNIGHCDTNAAQIVDASLDDAAVFLKAIVSASPVFGSRWRLLFDTSQTYIYGPPVRTGLIPLPFQPGTGGTLFTWVIHYETGMETAFLLWPDRSSAIMIVASEATSRPTTPLVQDALDAGGQALGVDVAYPAEPPPVRIEGLPGTYRSAEPTGAWEGERVFLVEPVGDDPLAMRMTVGSLSYRLTADEQVPDLFRFVHGPGAAKVVRFWRDASGTAFAISGPEITPPAFRDP